MCCDVTETTGITSNTILMISTIGNILVAILVPIVIKFIERNSQVKHLQSELYSKRRLKLIEEYVEYVGLAISRRTNYYKENPARNLVLMYVGRRMHHYIDDIDDCIRNNDFDKAEKLLCEFCHKLKVFD